MDIANNLKIPFESIVKDVALKAVVGLVKGDRDAVDVMNLGSMAGASLIYSNFGSGVADQIPLIKDLDKLLSSVMEKTVFISLYDGLIQMGLGKRVSFIDEFIDNAFAFGVYDLITKYLNTSK